MNSSYINIKPMKDQMIVDMMIAYLALWHRLTINKTAWPTKHILDNKASKDFKTAIRKNCKILLEPLKYKKVKMLIKPYKHSKVT